MYNNAGNALLFLIDTLLALYVVVLLLRTVLQLTHAPFHNPLSQFVWRITTRPVGWLALGVPRWRNLDTAALVLALVLCFVNVELDIALIPLPFSGQPLLALWWAILKMLTLLCDLYFFTILAQALLSWLSPSQYSPATAILWSINEPLLKPVRKRLPPIAGLDLSPLVILIALQVINLLIPLLPALR